MKNNYLTISKMAKITNIPIRTLHYYDQIDLFKPVYVDSQTNYRYYDETQIDQLDLIKSLKYIGTPLKSIKYAQSLTPEQLLEFLTEQEQIVEQKVKNILEVQQALLKIKKLLGEQVSIPYFNEIYETAVSSQRLLAIKTEKLGLLNVPSEYISLLAKAAEREGTIISKYGGIYELKEYEGIEHMHYDYLFTPLLIERYVGLIQANEEILVMEAGKYASIAFLLDHTDAYFTAYKKLFAAVKNPQSPVYEVYMPATYSSAELTEYIIELKVKII